MSHCVSSSAVAQKVCDAFSRDSSRARSAIVAQGMSFLFSVGECCLSLVVKRSGFFISLTQDVIYELSCLKQLSQASIGAGADLKRKRGSNLFHFTEGLLPLALGWLRASLRLRTPPLLRRILALLFRLRLQIQRMCSGKIFAGIYALYCGMVLLIAVGIFAVPIVHRFLHHFHLEGERKDQ